MFQHSLAFDRPAYLLLLLLIPVMWWLGYRSLSGLGRFRRLFALTLRSLVVLLIVFALADVQYERRSEGLTVVYLLDQSLSVPADQREVMIEYVRKSIKQHRDDSRGDRFAVIVFGRDAEVEVPPVSADEALHGRVESLLDPEYTDLATAIQRAKAIFPYDTAKRIVLVTDGNQNIGNGYREARTAADAGVSIDVVPVFIEPGGEVAVEKVDIPAGVRRGQPFDMRVVVRNDAKEGEDRPVKGRLVVIRKAGEREDTIAEQDVTVGSGKQVFNIDQQIDQPDFYTYEARFVADNAADDRMAQNNKASAFTHIRGKGLVLFIENVEKKGEFDHLVERLRASDIEVTVTGSDQLFNSLAELQRYDAVVLANVGRSSVDDVDNVASFSDEQIEMLVRNTRELGCGLVMLGGPDSYGAGGWANTKLEEAMPVDFQIKSTQVVPVGALCLMMHAGEMPQSNYWQKRIGVEAIKLLGARDYCGMVQWNGSDQWLWGQSSGGMVRVVLRQMMLARIDRMAIGDMPAFDGAMRMGAAAFAKLNDAAVKHMIIISDGDPTPPNAATIRALTQQKAKVTTVAVGSHGVLGSQTMRDIANKTGGKYYEVKNANALPKIYQREARRVAMPLVYERPDPMTPIIMSPEHEILRGVEGGVPPITGYVLTTVKQNPLVEVLLATPSPAKEENTTLLAAWTYGAGKTVAMTTDVGQRWAKPWTAWDGYDKLFSQVVRWAMRPTGDTGDYTVATDVRDGRTELVVSAMGDDESFLNNQSMTAQAVTPDMKTVEIPIEQVAPGRYVGSFPSEMAGSYLIMVNPGQGKAQIRTGVNVGYSAEYRDNESNIALLKSLAKIPADNDPKLTGDYTEEGLAAVALAEKIVANPFRRDQKPAVMHQSIWPWLIVFGSCLFWGDVFVRRVQMNFDWLLAVLGRARDYVLRREREVAVPETMSRLRTRKAEIGEQIEGRRTAARFEITDPTIAEGPPPVEGGPAAPTERIQPAQELKPETPPGESYTERLLKAKKQVWQDRPEDKK